MGSKKGPKYNEQRAYDSQVRAAQAQAKYGVYGVNSALGGLNTQQNMDGTYSLVYDLNDSDKIRQNLINQGLGNLSLDPTVAQEAYYNQATRQLLPQFQWDQDRLHDQLVNRGIAPGTALYNKQMNQLRQTQNEQLANISDQAVWQGQNYLASQIGNIGSLASQYDMLNLPSLSGSTGAQFNETYSQKFANDQARAKANAGIASTIGSLAGTAIGAYLGGPGGAAAGNAVGGQFGGLIDENRG